MSYVKSLDFTIFFFGSQVRSNNGVVRPIRRIPQPSYPMVKLTQAEIAAMIHRKEQRIRILTEEAEKRSEIVKKKKKNGKKKSVKNLMNHIFHHKKNLSASVNNLNRMSPENSFTGSRSVIGHPNRQNGYPVIGRRDQRCNPRIYRRMPEYPENGNSSMIRYSETGSSSMIRYSETGSGSIVRRPSVDTISTYLSNNYPDRNPNSRYGGSLGSQELLDYYNYNYSGGDRDSVFTDDSSGIKLGDSVSVLSENPAPIRGTEAPNPDHLLWNRRQRILSDPNLAPFPRNDNQNGAGLVNPDDDDDPDSEEEDEIYVNQRQICQFNQDNKR